MTLTRLLPYVEWRKHEEITHDMPEEISGDRWQTAIWLDVLVDEQLNRHLREIERALEGVE